MYCHIKKVKFMKKKVFIMGLDGGSWNILTSIMREGKMSHLAKLIKKGASGVLKSSIPPLTPPAWASFQTGVNPGKHGIFNFFKYNPKNNESHLVSSKDLMTKTIWELISEKNKTVVVINVPITYPPKKIKGCLIGGIMTPSTEVQFTYPQNLYKELLNEIGDYKIYINPQDFFEDSLEIFIDKLIYIEKKRLEASFYLMDKYDWDFFMIHNQSLDVLQHLLWTSIDKNHPEFDETKWKIVSKFYDSVDNGIGEIIKKLDNCTTFIIMSDHGFNNLEKNINLTQWLQEQNFLVLKSTDEITKLENLSNMIKILKLQNKSDFFNKENMIMKKNLNLLIDWSKTKAFIPQTGIYGYIRINCKGREKNGIIDQEYEYETIREELRKKLMQLKDPSTRMRVVERVFKREEVYRGPMIHHAPDLIVKPKKGYAFIQKLDENNVYSKTSIKKDYKGTHGEDGIFIFYGNSIRRERNLKIANIIDIAPTVLYLLEIKIPDYIDGKILKKVMK